MTLNIEGKPRPLFAYSYQTVDDVKGNKDGLVQLGEKVRLLVKVKNIGQGAALQDRGHPAQRPGQEGILISAGRFDGQGPGGRARPRPSRSSTRCGPSSRATTTSSS